MENYRITIVLLTGILVTATVHAGCMEDLDILKEEMETRFEYDPPQEVMESFNTAMEYCANGYESESNDAINQTYSLMSNL